MNGLPYYKAYPRDFFEGTIGLDFEEKAAYRLLLDLIYMHGGRLADEPRFIAGHLGCSVKKWNSLREAILARGKIVVSGGYLGNIRADKELDSLKSFQDKQRKNAGKPKKNNNIGEATAEPQGKPNERHTEPDTEATSVAVRAGARAAAPQSLNSGDRIALLEAMGIGPDGITGPSSFIGTTADMADAAKWSAMGLTLAEQIGVIRDACGRQRLKQPDWMPRRFVYFTGAMQDFAAKRGQAAGQGKPSGDIDARIAKWNRIAGQA